MFLHLNSWKRYTFHIFGAKSALKSRNWPKMTKIRYLQMAIFQKNITSKMDENGLKYMSRTNLHFEWQQLQFALGRCSTTPATQIQSGRTEGEDKQKLKHTSAAAREEKTLNIVKKIRFSLCFATSFLASKSLQCDLWLSIIKWESQANMDMYQFWYKCEYRY